MMPKKAGIAGIDISKPLQCHNILDFRSFSASLNAPKIIHYLPS